MGLPQERQRIYSDGLGKINMNAPTKANSQAIAKTEPVAKSENGGTIDIEINKLVPCLEDAKTGEILPTEVRTMERRDLLNFSKKNGWYVDWVSRPDGEKIHGVFLKGERSPQGLVSLRYEKGCTYVALAVTAPHNNKMFVGDKVKYKGVGGHLFAIAVEESLKNGGDGAVYGYAANGKVLKHYIDKFGATHIPVVHEFQFLIEGEASMNLLKTYNYERR